MKLAAVALAALFSLLASAPVTEAGGYHVRHRHAALPAHLPPGVTYRPYKYDYGWTGGYPARTVYRRGWIICDGGSCYRYAPLLHLPKPGWGGW